MEKVPMTIVGYEDLQQEIKQLKTIERPLIIEAIAEASRVVKKGGRILIVDMQQHSRDEFKHTMGHVHLGFSEEDIELLAKKAGCSLHAYHRLPPKFDARGPSLFTAILKVL